MEVPGLPSRVHEEFGSKRRFVPMNDMLSNRIKRMKLSGESATRPILSGERLWGSSYIRSLYCSEKDKNTFRIRFKRRRKEISATETKYRCHAARRSTVAVLKYYGEARSKAMEALLALYGLWPLRPKLTLRYGGLKSVIDADGVFYTPSTGSVVAFADFAKMAERRAKHPMTLLPETRTEKKECGVCRAKEHLRIKPEKEEEDAQIALMMAAMVQEMLRRASWKQRGDRIPLGAWARVIGIGGGRIYMYRSWVPRRFVEKFAADEGFVVEYRSISLKDEDKVIEQLGCLLKTRSPPSVQPGAAAAA